MDKNKKNNKNMKPETIERIIKYGFIGVVAVVVLSIAINFLMNSTTSYAAKIGDEKVRVGEFELNFDQVKYYMLAEAGIGEGTPEADTFWSTANFNGLSAVDEAKRRAMESLKDQKIMLIKAKENNIGLEKADTDYIKDRIDQLILENGNSRSKAEDYLKNNFGISMNEFKKMNEEMILTQKMYTQEIETADVPEEDIKKFYDENVENYDTVTVRHILISTIDLEKNEAKSEEDKKLAEDKAKDILARINAGEDMKKLAKENSDDKPSVDENEGEYTFTKKDSYMPEFMDWAFNAKTDETGIVETSYGYHVMRLENRETAPYDKVKVEIKDELAQEIFTSKMEEWKKDPAYDVKTNSKVYDAIK